MYVQAQFKINFGDGIAQSHQQSMLFPIIGNHANVMVVRTDLQQSHPAVSRKLSEKTVLAQTTWDGGQLFVQKASNGDDGKRNDDNTSGHGQ